MIRSHRAKHKHRAYLAVLVVPALIAGAYFAAPGGTDPSATAPVDLHVPLGMTPDDLGQWCVDAQQRGTSGLSARAVEWLKGCAESFGRHPQTPQPTPSSTTAPATPTSAPTTSPSTTTPAPTIPAPTVTGWPGATNTGVPAGTALSTYTGPCNITTPNTVIDAKTVNCVLNIQTTGVKITRSLINGSVTNGDDTRTSFTMTDSEVSTGVDQTGVSEVNFTLLRVNVHGGNRQVSCYSHCTVQDSWLHGTRITTVSHASAMRAGQFTTIIHNTLACDVADTPQGGGCSADLTGYPDFEPIHDLLAQGNLFVATPAYFCAYGGWNPGKPYNDDPSNATNIVFRANTFERGASGRCGGPTDGGPPITSFVPTRSGNLFTANVWAPDGKPVTL